MQAQSVLSSLSILFNVPLFMAALRRIRKVYPSVLISLTQSFSEVADVELLSACEKDIESDSVPGYGRTQSHHYYQWPGSVTFSVSPSSCTNYLPECLGICAAGWTNCLSYPVDFLGAQQIGKGEYREHVSTRTEMQLFSAGSHVCVTMPAPPYS